MAQETACYTEGMTNDSIASLTDTDLLTETARAASVERRSTADLLVLLAEVDVRKLYLARGYSSLFVYCTQSLHLSEAAAYARITAARASRSFPDILPNLTNGSVTLTTISLLAAHLTDENHEALLHAARDKSRREVERLVASLVPVPDIASTLRRSPGRHVSPAAPTPTPQAALLTAPTLAAPVGPPEPARPWSPSPASRPIVAPLGGDRFLLRVMLGTGAHQKLERARALLRHQIPNGDPAAVVERALTVLVEQLEKVKYASTRTPRASSATGVATSRRVPAAVKRMVWTRDGGRCAFVGADGRCIEVGFLEFHHVVPFASGGATDAGNIQLRCRAHNVYEATLFEQSSETAPSSPSAPSTDPRARS